MDQGSCEQWDSGMTEGRHPTFSELPGPNDRWWSSRVFRVLFFAAAVAATVLVGLALVSALHNDQGAITLMLSVYGCLFVAWLAFAGIIFDLGLKGWHLLLRSPVILVAAVLLLLSPLAFLLAQPARFVRRPRVGAAGQVYREWGIASRSRFAARRPWLTRLPAAVHVISGRFTLFGPEAPDPRETICWPFFLARYDLKPGLFPKRGGLETVGRGGSALPQILVALMARGVPDDPDAMLLLARAPRDETGPVALDGGDPCAVHPAVITAKERDFVCDELLSAGYADQMIIGRVSDAAQLIGHAWKQWRHTPVTVTSHDEQVA
jgi:hypothetical protein